MDSDLEVRGGRFGGRVRFLDRVRSYWHWFRQPAGSEPRGPAGSIVLADLMSFARMGEIPPFSLDAVQMARYMGRQDMCIRIMQHLHMRPEELYELLAGRQISPEK